MTCCVVGEASGALRRVCGALARYWPIVVNGAGNGAAAAMNWSNGAHLPAAIHAAMGLAPIAVVGALAFIDRRRSTP
jgi:hypothetical protein